MSNLLNNLYKTCQTCHCSIIIVSFVTPQNIKNKTKDSTQCGKIYILVVQSKRQHIFWKDLNHQCTILKKAYRYIISVQPERQQIFFPYRCYQLIISQYQSIISICSYVSMLHHCPRLGKSRTLTQMFSLAKFAYVQSPRGQ